MRKALICFVFVPVILGVQYLDACTIVMVSRGDVVLVGNNEDWTYPFNKIWIVPASKNEYGRICFGFAFDLQGRYTTGGMNDQGLFIDGNGLGASTGWKPVKGKPTFKGILEDHILAHCATVEDAIQFFENNNVPNLKNGRFPIADKTGSTVIVEWSHGKTQFIRKKGDYQISTNFVVSNYKPGDYPCYRYKLADQLLSNVPGYSVDIIRKVLAATHYLSSGSITLFSYICNLKNGNIYIYNFHNFEDMVEMNLDKELEKGEKSYYIPRLFSYVPFAQWNTVPASIGKVLLRMVNSKKMETIKKNIPELRRLSQESFNHDFTESALNNLGYRLLERDRIEAAIDVFKLNVSEYPDSSNAYDSLGEAYAKNHRFDPAIASYTKSVELDPGNENGKQQLKLLKKKVSQEQEK